MFCLLEQFLSGSLVSLINAITAVVPVKDDGWSCLMEKVITLLTDLFLLGFCAGVLLSLQG